MRERGYRDSVTRALSHDPSATAPLLSARHVIAVGAGRGGVGKSLVAASLAIYFAQLGRKVVLADGDSAGGNLHTQFGVSAATREPVLDREGTHGLDESLVPTLVPGLSLLPAAHESIHAPTIHRTGRKDRWIARLRALPVDYVVIDAGPGHSAFALDVMAAADMAIAVAIPEPPAIEETYRFLRAWFLRRLRRAVRRDKIRSALLSRALGQAEPLPGPVDLMRALAKLDRSLAELAWLEARSMNLALVVNQTRVRSDLDMGARMTNLSARHYGIPIEDLGHIEQDDTVWLAVRRNQPLLIDSPTSKAARNLERIARRVLALLTTPDSRGLPSVPMNIGVTSLYDALGVARAATDEDIRRAFKRQRDVYAPGSLASASLLSETLLRSERARTDEAHDTLLDPVRRRAYDLSTFPDTQTQPQTATPARAALAAEQLALQGELATEIGPDTDFTGELLRRVRESQGIELTEIANFTRISKSHLVAIEAEAYASLPAPL